MRRAFSTLLFAFFMPLFALAQSGPASAPEMATGLRQSGKIYVVVLVLATIFAGIIAFLIHLERRIARMEREAGIKA